MRALVTGGAGYIGSHAVIRLKEAGHEAVVLDNLSEGHREAVGQCEFIRADLSDEDAVFVILKRHNPDVVMHFAASAYVGESVECPEDYYFNNVVNTLKLLRAMRRAGVKLLVFSSSCSVYGSTTQTPITEDCPFQPISPYGRTKAIVERILKDYSQAYGLRYASLRYFNAAGAMPDGSLGEDHRRETHLIPIVLRVGLGKQKSVVIYGTDYPTQDGTCIRDYVHVLDLGKAHVMAMEALPTRTSAVYNLGIGRGYSVREVIQTAQEVTGRKIPTEPGPPRAGDPAVLVASPRKIKAELGWQPTYLSLTEIIETAWKWHSTHPDGFVSAD